MEALVIYDSVFGNTEKVALAIADALRTSATVDVTRATEATPARLQGKDLIVVGAPTRAFKPTAAVTGFLKNLSKSALAGTKVAAFDTRMDVEKVDVKILVFLASKFGYAAEKLERLLVKKGGTAAGAPEGFIVLESEGPLADGELERAADWAKHLLSA